MSDVKGLMAGKRGLIMGVANDRSIAWGIAKAVAAQGGELAFTYQGEALERRVRPLAELVGANILLPCDVTDDASIDATFATLKEKWGSLDFVVHAIAFSDKDELKGKYVDTSRGNFLRTLDISCFSFTAVALRAKDMMPNGGALVTLTYLGAERVMPHYNVMGVAKAALECSVRYLAADLGDQAIRVNSISAGPIKTLAASGIGDFRQILRWNELNAPLNRNVTIEDVGGAGLYLVSDLSKGVTGELHHVDGGYNVVGMLRPELAADLAEMLRNFSKTDSERFWMSHNTFGHLFRFTTWGESHGPALGVVVDGTPPGIEIDSARIQHWLEPRKPGQSRFVTQRREPDAVEILSGVFEGKSTGTPISLMIKNEDQRSKDYGKIAEQFRPGHADYTYWAKYQGNRDYRGGGRSSARETASRVAAGAVAREVLNHILPRPVEIKGALIQIGPHKIDRKAWDWGEVEKNPFWSPDAATVLVWEEFLDTVRKSGSSTGAVIEVVAKNVPVGLGAPLYGKLDADLASAMMSINAVKGVEIGAGFAAAALSGEENADEMRMADGKVKFLSNQAGGILGGISTGQDVVVRFAVKPTSSINTPRKGVTTTGEEVDVSTTGRHDPCVGIRAVPVGEAMLAIVLADHLLRQRGQVGKIG